MIICPGFNGMTVISLRVHVPRLCKEKDSEGGGEEAASTGHFPPKLT